MPLSEIFISSVKHREAHGLIVRKDDQMRNIFRRVERKDIFRYDTLADTLRFSLFPFFFICVKLSPYKYFFYDIIAHHFLHSLQSYVV